MNLNKMQLLIIWMFFLMLVMIYIGANSCHGQITCTNYILSDKEFTNVNMYTRDRYMQIFGYAYSAYDIDYSFTVFSNRGINPLVFYLTAWKEGRPRDSWMLGCGSHIKWEAIKEFEEQVKACANTWRNHFDQAEQYHYRVLLFERGYITVKNKSTYALYKYTPRWYQFIYGDWHGNIFVRPIWNDLKKMMNRGTL